MAGGKKPSTVDPKDGDGEQPIPFNPNPVDLYIYHTLLQDGPPGDLQTTGLVKPPFVSDVGGANLEPENAEALMHAASSPDDLPPTNTTGGVSSSYGFTNDSQGHSPPAVTGPAETNSDSRRVVNNQLEGHLMKTVCDMSLIRFEEKGEHTSSSSRSPPSTHEDRLLRQNRVVDSFVPRFVSGCGDLEWRLHSCFHALQHSYNHLENEDGSGLSELAKLGLKTNIRVLLLLISTHQGSPQNSYIVGEVLRIAQDVISQMPANFIDPSSAVGRDVADALIPVLEFLKTVVVQPRHSLPFTPSPSGSLTQNTSLLGLPSFLQSDTPTDDHGSMAVKLLLSASVTIGSLQSVLYLTNVLLTREVEAMYDVRSALEILRERGKEVIRVKEKRKRAIENAAQSKSNNASVKSEKATSSPSSAAQSSSPTDTDAAAATSSSTAEVPESKSNEAEHNTSVPLKHTYAARLPIEDLRKPLALFDRSDVAMYLERLADIEDVSGSTASALIFSYLDEYIEDFGSQAYPFQGKSTLSSLMWMPMKMASRESNALRVGTILDVQDTVQKWCVGRVIAVNDDGDLHIHYEGWSDKWNEWIPADSERVAPHKTHTKGDEVGPKRRGYTAKPGISAGSKNNQQESPSDFVSFLNAPLCLQVHANTFTSLVSTLSHMYTLIFDRAPPPSSSSSSSSSSSPGDANSPESPNSPDSFAQKERFNHLFILIVCLRLLKVHLFQLSRAVCSGHLKRQNVISDQLRDFLYKKLTSLLVVVDTLTLPSDYPFQEHLLSLKTVIRKEARETIRDGFEIFHGSFLDQLNLASELLEKKAANDTPFSDLDHLLLNISLDRLSSFSDVFIVLLGVSQGSRVHGDMYDAALLRLMRGLLEVSFKENIAMVSTSGSPKNRSSDVMVGQERFVLQRLQHQLVAHVQSLHYHEQQKSDAKSTGNQVDLCGILDDPSILKPLQEHQLNLFRTSFPDDTQPLDRSNRRGPNNTEGGRRKERTASMAASPSGQSKDAPSASSSSFDLKKHCHFVPWKGSVGVILDYIKTLLSRCENLLESISTVSTAFCCFFCFYVSMCG